MPRSQSQSGVNEAIREDLVREAVRIVLVMEFFKKPIKLAEVVGNMSTKLSRKEQLQLVDRIRQHLTVFGYSLNVIDKTTFFLTSNNQPVPWISEHLNQETKAEKILLFIILAYLLMHEDHVLEEDLMKHLANLGILVEDKPIHDFFGDIKKMLHKFVDQLYLEKIKGNEEGSAELRWGLRARAEVSMTDVLEKVCKLGFKGKFKAKDFPAQLKLAAEQHV